MKTKFKRLLSTKAILLDGAMGTELQRRGLPQGACPEQWCLANPKILSHVHQQYVSSGAQLVYTCTFGANSFKLSQYGLQDVIKINQKIARVARQAVGDRVFLAGDIGPTGEFIQPFGPVLFDDAVNIFKQQIKGLLAGGVDLLVIETMMDIQEARAALIAAKELTDKFVMVTMTFDPSGRTLNGTDPVSALITLQSLGADAVGCNCSTGPEEMKSLIKAMRPYATVPLIAKPNAGLPKLINGQTVFEMNPLEFSKKAKGLINAGAHAVGGCCGTTPEHIQALSNAIRGVKPRIVTRRALGALSSPRDHVILDYPKEVIIVGESINPTRKKALQQEFLEKKTMLACQLAKQQELDGARLLDVNVGAPGVSEPDILPRVVCALSVSSRLPLVIDTSDMVAMEKTLRVYPGRALINSISAEKKRMNKLLDLAARYGAMLIALPVGLKGMPKNFLERTRAVQFIVSNAKKKNIPKDNIVVDALVMAVSSSPASALDTLKVVRWCKKTLKCASIVGLSNVSFGLPSRQVLNATFLSLLKKQGLTMAIAHPQHVAADEDQFAIQLLLNKDPDARRYIERSQVFSSKTTSASISLSIQDGITQAILDGDREHIKELIQIAESQGLSASDMVHNVMIPAINKVGELFESKQYFLPQLVASAETMKKGFIYLEPKLTRSEGSHLKKIVVILATVKGDIHDIGKNIVALMLKNHGFDVIDLGKDVSPLTIIQEIKRHKNPIVGLSALMTTTMVNMDEVIRLAKKDHVDCRFMLGGAVVTKEYAEQLGAEFSRDGVQAVAVAKRLAKSS